MTINLHQVIHYIIHFFKAKRNGHGVHSPFAYRLCEEVFYSRESFYDFEVLAAVRTDLLMNHATLSIEDFGAGSKTFKSNTRKVKEIAAKGVSTKEQSELLYRLMNFFKLSKRAGAWNLTGTEHTLHGEGE